MPDDGEYETVAGFVTDRLDRLPEVGDEVRRRGRRLRVERIDGSRVDRLRFTPRRPRRRRRAGERRRRTSRRADQAPDAAEAGMSEYVPACVWLVVLLAANAFFVGAEFAVISARRSQIEPRAEAGSRPRGPRCGRWSTPR